MFAIVFASFAVLCSLISLGLSLWAVYQSRIALRLAQKTVDDNRVWALVDDLTRQLNYFHQIGQQMAGFELEKARIDAEKHREIAKTALALGDGVPEGDEGTRGVGAKHGQRDGHSRHDLNPPQRNARI